MGKRTIGIMNLVLVVLGLGGSEAAIRFVQETNSEIVLLELDEYLCKQASAPSVIFRNVTDYLSPQDLQEISKQAARICHQWYKCGDADLTVWKGVSLGEIAEHSLYIYLIDRLQGIALARKATDALHPSQVVFCGIASPFSEAFSYVARYRDIPFLHLQSAVATDASDQRDRGTGKFRLYHKVQSIVGKLRTEKHKFIQHGLDRVVEKMQTHATRVQTTIAEWVWDYLPCLQAVRLSLRRWLHEQLRRRRVLVMITPHHTLLWLIDILKRDPRFSVHEIDRQKVRSLEWVRLNYWTRPEWHQITPIVGGRAAYFDRIWSRLSAEYASHQAFILNGLPLWGFLQDKLQNLLTDVFPRSALIVEAQDKLLDVELPHLVVFVMPFGGGQRSLSLLASLRADMKSVIRFEAAQIVGDPDRQCLRGVDFLLTWGLTGALLYAKEGYRSEQIQILGHPKVDFSHSGERQRVNQPRK